MKDQTLIDNPRKSIKTPNQTPQSQRKNSVPLTDPQNELETPQIQYETEYDSANMLEENYRTNNEQRASRRSVDQVQNLKNVKEFSGSDEGKTAQNGGVQQLIQLYDSLGNTNINKEGRKSEPKQDGQRLERLSTGSKKQTQMISSQAEEITQNGEDNKDDDWRTATQAQRKAEESLDEQKNTNAGIKAQEETEFQKALASRKSGASNPDQKQKEQDENELQRQIYPNAETKPKKIVKKVKKVKKKTVSNHQPVSNSINPNTDQAYEQDDVLQNDMGEFNSHNTDNIQQLSSQVKRKLIDQNSKQSELESQNFEKDDKLASIAKGKKKSNLQNSKKTLNIEPDDRLVNIYSNQQHLFSNNPTMFNTPNNHSSEAKNQLSSNKKTQSQNLQEREFNQVGCAKSSSQQNFQTEDLRNPKIANQQNAAYDPRRESDALKAGSSENVVATQQNKAKKYLIF